MRGIQSTARLGLAAPLLMLLSIPNEREERGQEKDQRRGAG
jgi:hypothetical protein